LLLFHRFLGFGLGLDLLLQISLWFSVSSFFKFNFFFFFFNDFDFRFRNSAVVCVWSFQLLWLNWELQILDQEHVSPDLILFFINLFIFCLNWVFQEYFFCNFCNGYLVWILLMILWIWYYIFSYSKLWFRVFFFN
jgi:hypothetical protein